MNLLDAMDSHNRCSSFDGALLMMPVINEVVILAHRIRISEILPWDRKFYLTHDILHNTSSNVFMRTCILA